MEIEGRLIGNRYEVIEKIGKGGMATVYKAKDLTLKRNVAIKVLKDEFTTDEEFIKRFNIEAQSAASLTHPNIVSIFDVGNEDNIYYIVMELIQGKTLKEIINEDGILPWKWSLNIAIQIASALETAHKNNIIHRDIKPHNIIITEDGIAKVMDFGIAKAVSNSTITAFGTTIGSVHYFSPEHARGGFTDAKSDIYSLGIVMYEMLTGKVPFDADTPVSIALKHMQEEPIEPIKLNPSIPNAVNKIILKAMQKEASARYESATEMLKDLGLALKNPEGNFVNEDISKEGYTQVLPKITDDINIKNGSRYNNEVEEKQTKPKAQEKPTKKKNFFEKYPIVKYLIIAVLIIVIPVIGFFAAQGIMNAGRGKDVELPNFVNMTKEEAEEVAKKANLELEIEEKFNKDIEEGKIISQDPPYIEKYSVKENTKVKIVVSKGADIRKVPKVSGLKYEEAEEILNEETFVIEKIEQTSEKVEAGIVIKQEPAKDTEAYAGDTIKVYVSTGAKQITMEYVLGQKESDAKSKLTKLGFEVNVVYEEDTSKDDGIVLKQNIEAGEQVKDGSEVILTVNKIQKVKEGSLHINLKSVLAREGKDTIDKDSEGNEINPEVLVEIKVTSEGKEETVYSQKHRKDTSSINKQVLGKGTITIKLFADGIKITEKQLNLNVEDPVLSFD